MKRIIFTVTNDLVYDQRMQRICGSLASNGYAVTLVGRRLPGSPPLNEASYSQKRIYCYFKKGKWFYTEYNLRLLIYLFFKRTDAICAIDLDTILPCLYISKWKKIKRIYDAHELFTGLKEVVSRPSVYHRWKKIEEKALPQFPHGYTVSSSIAKEFNNRYGVQYETIRNVPVLRSSTPAQDSGQKFLLYQGAINEARAFEWLIPAMKQVNARLVMIGDGNFMAKLKQLIKENKVEDKVELKGMMPPEELWQWTQKATLGIALAENTGLNQYYALPNKFFDYVHGGLPQLTMDFPEYQELNHQWQVAVLTDNLAPATIAQTINNLLDNDVLLNKLRLNCLAARQEWCWQKEEKKLLSFYNAVFRS